MQLYELIQSMTKPERRYFGSYVKPSGNGQPPKYLSLFKMLLKEKSYDEEKITKKGYTYDDKNLLIEKILEALHVFHSRKSVEVEIQTLLSQILILKEKNIRKELSKRLRRAKKLAIENEDLTSLLHILDREKEFVFEAGKIDEYKRLQKEQKQTLKKLVDEMHYADTVERSSLILLEDVGLNNAENRERFEQLVDDSILSAPSPDASTYTKITYHGIKHQHAQVRNDKVQSLHHAQEIINLIESKPFMVKRDGYSLLRVYFSMRSSLVRFGRLHTDASHYKFLKNTEVALRNPVQRQTTYNYFIREYTMSLNKTDGEALIQQINNEYLSDIKVDYQIEISYHIAIFYGTFGKWDKSLSWMKNIFSIKRPVVYKHFQYKARFYALIIHYERSVDDVLTHIQSVQKYLKRNNYEHGIEQQVLKLMEDLSQELHHRKKISIWEKMYDLLSNEPNIRHVVPIPMENFKQWCKSKIEGVSIAEVIRMERIRQNEVLES